MFTFEVFLAIKFFDHMILLSTLKQISIEWRRIIMTKCYNRNEIIDTTESEMAKRIEFYLESITDRLFYCYVEHPLKKCTYYCAYAKMYTYI